MHDYDHLIEITPTPTDSLVTRWDDHPGAHAEWYAIDDAMYEAALSRDAERVDRAVACNDDDCRRLTAWLDNRGWQWSDDGQCTIGAYSDGTYCLVDSTDDED